MVQPIYTAVQELRKTSAFRTLLDCMESGVQEEMENFFLKEFPNNEERILEIGSIRASLKTCANLRILSKDPNEVNKSKAEYPQGSAESWTA
jgi:hypothetical protein